MKFRTVRSSLAYLVLGAGCANDLPPDSPQIRLEFGLERRADSQFCFAADDALGGTPPAPLVLRNDKTSCIRMTVLKPDGTPITFKEGDDLEDAAASSSCSIRPNVGESGLDPDEQIGFVLRTEDRKERGELFPAVLSPDEPIALRLDVFEGNERIGTGITAPFLPVGAGQERALTLLGDDRLSCLLPGQGSTTLNEARAFHSATRVGDPAAGELEGLLIAGGITSLPALSDGIGATETLEIFDRRSMRFTSAGALASPRALHEAVAMPSFQGELHVVLVGGTTKPQGMTFEVAPQNNQGGFINAKSAFPLMPSFTRGATGYDDEAGAGAEVVRLDASDLSVIGTVPLDTLPGRFGAAAAGAGESLLVFGGIATSQGQGCAPLGGLQNVLCSDAFLLHRENATSYSQTALPPLATPRVGASAVLLPGDPQRVLVLGGHTAGPAAEIYTLDATGTAAVSEAPAVNLVGLSAEQLQRAFFALSLVPPDPENPDLIELLWFGGEQLADPAQLGNGRLIIDPPPANFAARVTVNLNGAAGPELTVSSLALPEITRPDPADPIFNIDAFTVNFNGAPRDFSFVELDTASEEVALDPNDPVCGGNCNPLTNLGERFVYPAVATTTDPGEGRRVLLFGGARDLLFPQDAVFELDLDEDPDALRELANPRGGSLHLYRRAVGLRASVLPGRGAFPSLVVLTGGLSGLPLPIADAQGEFSELFLLSNFISAADPAFQQVRRDVSFYPFAVASPEPAADACSPGAEIAVFEGEACGFANSSIGD